MIDFPPVYNEVAQSRRRVTQPIIASRTFEDGDPGVHLLIEGVAYFIPKDEARRVARKILFNQE